MQITCGAVPEHFFYPWKVWMKKNTGQMADWTWKEYPGGSGAMIQDMEEGKLDAAFLLTESALLARSKGSPIEILFPFVQSPLLWGIFTAKENPITKVEEGKTYAISRYRSGSHLMAILESEIRGKTINSNEWILVNNLDGARKALISGEADLFFWEKWTTKPFIDKGEFRMLDVFASPWPAFVFCVHKNLTQNTKLIKDIEEDYRQVCMVAGELAGNKSQLSTKIAENYDLKEADALEWLSHVKWADDPKDSLVFLAEASEIMKKAGILSP